MAALLDLGDGLGEPGLDTRDLGELGLDTCDLGELGLATWASTCDLGEPDTRDLGGLDTPATWASPASTPATWASPASTPENKKPAILAGGCAPLFLP